MCFLLFEKHNFIYLAILSKTFKSSCIINQLPLLIKPLINTFYLVKQHFSSIFKQCASQQEMELILHLILSHLVRIISVLFVSFLEYRPDSKFKSWALILNRHKAFLKLKLSSIKYFSMFKVFLTLKYVVNLPDDKLSLSSFQYFSNCFLSRNLTILISSVSV